MMTEKMKAIVLTKPCKADELTTTKVSIPKVKPGYDLIKIKALGVNESEVTSRKGESDPDFQFPRILEIEGAGVIAETCKNSKFKVGQKVITMMGGMGRSLDGSYAKYTLVKEENIIPFESDLDCSIIGALPEMLQTAYGSLSQGLHIKKDDTLLVRGGSSTVGLTAAILAHHMGAKVITTTRNEKKLAKMKELGIDYPVLDDKQFKQTAKKIAPTGVDKVLELVGFSTLFEDMSLAKQGAYTCFTGALGGQWTLDNFSPFMIPTGVFLTSYAGEY
ncbi:zinc-binding dehydrogenase [Lactobacillus helveticus]|uniref:zinc-binding dehydrogenase n=1 Tax=Lactobacillus helveticus TaxID=1587 RepID=UPI0031E484AC